MLANGELIEGVTGVSSMHAPLTHVSYMRIKRD